jgi:photosystem II stability/assembly factor-like uncharacterized protein
VDPRDRAHLYFCYFDIGLLQSFDSGRSFTPTVDGMKNRGNTFAVAFDPGDPKIVYAGTGQWASNHGDVCRSDDGGFTWRVVGTPATGLPDGQTHCVVVDPSSPTSARRIFVTVGGAGVYRTDDAGASWRPCNGGLGNHDVRDLALASGNRSTLYALLGGSTSSGGGVYHSGDGGASWRRTSAAWPWSDAKALAICGTDPRRLYVAAREEGTGGRYYPGGVFASVDGGATWKRVLADRFAWALAVDPRDGDVVYAGCTDHPYHDDAIGSGVLRSRDGGRTWQCLNNGGLTCHNIGCLTVDPFVPDRLYAGTHGNGVFVLTP